MKRTDAPVADIIGKARSAVRRRDAETLTAMMREVSGREPAAWGTIIGFGSCHYRYPTGTEGDMPVMGFSPRAQATTVYLMATSARAEALARLGPHTTGVSCLYIKNLDDVDLGVLREILVRDLALVEGGDTPGAEITVQD